MEEECSDILKEFFIKLRDIKWVILKKN
jgi:hypothetical protein